MGLIHTRVTLGNARRRGLAPIEVEAVVDAGALHLCILEHVAPQLALHEFDRREVTLADGSKTVASYVGPLTVAIANRKGLTGAMMIGDEVLLGAIPMEDMDLVDRPATRDVGPNPQNPKIAVSVAKGFRTKHER